MTDSDIEQKNQDSDIEQKGRLLDGEQGEPAGSGVGYRRATVAIAGVIGLCLASAASAWATRLNTTTDHSSHDIDMSPEQLWSAIEPGYVLQSDSCPTHFHLELWNDASHGDVCRHDSSMNWYPAPHCEKMLVAPYSVHPGTREPCRTQTANTAQPPVQELSLVQWNLGHPKEATPLSEPLGFLDKNPDFFNLVNLNDPVHQFPLPGNVEPLNHSCPGTRLDSTTLFYNTDRWKLEPESSGSHCFPKGGAAVWGAFKPIMSGPHLLVVGAHFPYKVTSLGILGGSLVKPSLEDLKKQILGLIPTAGFGEGHEFVLLADTNAAATETNAEMFAYLGFTSGAETKTDAITCCNPAFILDPLLPAYPDRILTTIRGPSKPVTVHGLPAECHMTNCPFMHKPISVDLSL